MQAVGRTYGAPRIQAALRQQGICCRPQAGGALDAAACHHGLQRPHADCMHTTQRDPAALPAPNRLNQELTPRQHLIASGWPT